MSDRSLRPEIRNPLLHLPAANQIRALPLQSRQALAALLRDLSLDARERAERSWRQNKAPMAAYWKTVGVYAGHLHRLARPSKAELGIPAVAPQPQAAGSVSSSSGEDP